MREWGPESGALAGDEEGEEGLDAEVEVEDATDFRSGRWDKEPNFSPAWFSIRTHCITYRTVDRYGRCAARSDAGWIALCRLWSALQCLREEWDGCPSRASAWGCAEGDDGVARVGELAGLGAREVHLVYRTAPTYPRSGL